MLGSGYDQRLQRVVCYLTLAWRGLGLSLCVKTYVILGYFGALSCGCYGLSVG